MELHGAIVIVVLQSSTGPAWRVPPLSCPARGLTEAGKAGNVQYTKVCIITHVDQRRTMLEINASSCTRLLTTNDQTTDIIIHFGTAMENGSFTEPRKSTADWRIGVSVLATAMLYQCCRASSWQGSQHSQRRLFLRERHSPVVERIISWPGGQDAQFWVGVNSAIKGRNCVGETS